MREGEYRGEDGVVGGVVLLMGWGWQCLLYLRELGR